MTISEGEIVAECGKMILDWKHFEYPEEALRTVNLGKILEAKDFEITAPIASGELDVRAIEVIENNVRTKEKIVRAFVFDHKLQIDKDSGLCKIAVFERHRATGSHSISVVSGIGFQEPAAIAMTVAHDSHNLLIIGNDDHLMAQAANQISTMQGGVIVITSKETITFPLQIAGLMSTEPFEKVAEQSSAISKALIDAGCQLNYAFMTLSLLALVVIPEIRLSDKGLVRISEDGIQLVSMFV
jgi:adenine deaminase